MIEPDTKDWTWVLDRPCQECGFDCRHYPREETGARVRDNASTWKRVLGRNDVAVRPAPDVWSPLEYACHVRDVFRLYDYRLSLMLDRDNPLYPNWDQDETAIAERYGEQDPAVVTTELAAAAADVASRFDGVSGEQWSRPGRRSDGASFTVETFARYFLHDAVHHLHDVGA